MSEADGRHIDDSEEIVRIIRAGREERAAHLDRVIAEGFLSPPASLPRKRVTAGALIRDEGGRVLLVESIHKRSWLTPGGTVEGNESPAQGAAREVREELGVRLPIGRALVMQWVQEEGDPDGALHFAYDGGVVDDSTIAKFRLPLAELTAYRFVDAHSMQSLALPETADRVTAALDALSNGTFVELDG